MKVLIKAKCIQCGTVREIGAGDIPPGETPLCEKCGDIMIATESVIRDAGKPTKKSPYPEPFVMCADHKLRRGYIVCVHVAGGGIPDYVKLSRGKKSGEILCSDSFQHKRVENFVLICEGCAIRRGWLKAEDCAKRDAKEHERKIHRSIRRK